MVSLTFATPKRIHDVSPPCQFASAQFCQFASMSVRPRHFASVLFFLRLFAPAKNRVRTDGGEPPKKYEVIEKKTTDRLLPYEQLLLSNLSSQVRVNTVTVFSVCVYFIITIFLFVIRLCYCCWTLISHYYYWSILVVISNQFSPNDIFVFITLDRQQTNYLQTNIYTRATVISGAKRHKTL